jgi:putative transposase
MYPWRTGRSCVYKNIVHLVFVTKYRRDVFDFYMLSRLKQIFTETCTQMQCELIEFGGEDDHVHLLVNIPPKLAISNVVGKLKGKSSYFLRREYWNKLKIKLWGKNLWSPSYCVVSCGGAPLDIVKQYVKNQRKLPTAKQVNHSIKLSHKNNCPSKIGARLTQT